MLVDLWPQIEQDLEEISTALIEKGWKKKSNQLLCKDIRKRTWCIFLDHRILYFLLHGRPVAIPWVGVKVTGTPSIPSYVLQEIIEDLYYSNLRPFEDELGLLRLEKNLFGEDIVTFFINPNFPKGIVTSNITEE